MRVLSFHSPQEQDVAGTNTYSTQYALHYICSVVPSMRRKEDVRVTI